MRRRKPNQNHRQRLNPKRQLSQNQSHRQRPNPNRRQRLQPRKEEAAPAKEKGEFAIARAVVGTGVENKEPVGAADTFPASTEKVSCFIEATNVPKDMELTTVWSMGDKEMRKINATVKAGPRWRAWVDKKVGGIKGDWRVEIKDADGKVLKDVKFKVE